MRHLTLSWTTALLALATVGLVLAMACGGASAPPAETGEAAVPENVSSTQAAEAKPEKAMAESQPATTATEKQAPVMAEKPTVAAKETTANPEKQDMTMAEKPAAQVDQATAVMEKQTPGTAVKPEASAQELPPVGTQVGNLAPKFTLNLIGGEAISSAELMDRNQPSFLFFHATY